MKKLKIDTLEKLETFISNETIIIEKRLEVFVEALKDYKFFIIEIKYDETCKKIENVEAVARQMVRVVQDIREAPESKFHFGFSVLYKHN